MFGNSMVFLTGAVLSANIELPGKDEVHLSGEEGRHGAEASLVVPMVFPRFGLSTSGGRA